ncbi:MAG: hypothetical protein GX287_03025 [Fusobacteria bacterium]|nr:hypothetical protein [Fusobacteriota bacterium]
MLIILYSASNLPFYEFMQQEETLYILLGFFCVAVPIAILRQIDPIVDFIKKIEHYLFFIIFSDFK